MLMMHTDLWKMIEAESNFTCENVQRDRNQILLFI
jgi:hypothetical protein